MGKNWSEDSLAILDYDGLKFLKYSMETVTVAHDWNYIFTTYSPWIRAPKLPFLVFNKLKNEVQTFITRFRCYFNMKNEIQIIDHYFHAEIDFYFEFLMLSFVFHFHKKWKTKYSSFFVFHFHEGIEKRIT